MSAPSEIRPLQRGGYYTHCSCGVTRRRKTRRRERAGGLTAILFVLQAPVFFLLALGPRLLRRTLWARQLLLDIPVSGHARERARPVIAPLATAAEIAAIEENHLTLMAVASATDCVTSKAFNTDVFGEPLPASRAAPINRVCSLLEAILRRGSFPPGEPSVCGELMQ